MVCLSGLLCVWDTLLSESDLGNDGISLFSSYDRAVPTWHCGFTFLMTIGTDIFRTTDAILLAEDMVDINTAICSMCVIRSVWQSRPFHMQNYKMQWLYQSACRRHSWVVRLGRPKRWPRVALWHRRLFCPCCFVGYSTYIRIWIVITYDIF